MFFLPDVNICQLFFQLFPGFLVTDFPTAAAASALFGVSIGGVAALMSVIFAESLGVANIQDTLGLM